MASDDIDLDRGEPDDAASRRRRRRQQRTEEPAPSEGFTEREVRDQLTRAFEGIAKNRDARGDGELADAVREEGDAMTEGFVALTSAFTPLRLALVIALNLLITLLAFGRVGSILWYRWTARRAAAQQEEQYVEQGVPITEE